MLIRKQNAQEKSSIAEQQREVWLILFHLPLLQFCAWKCWQPSFQTNNFKPFFVHFYYCRDGLVKSLISNIYSQNMRLWMKSNHLMQREILSVMQNKSEKCL
jgi:hypothetical protein